MIKVKDALSMDCVFVDVRSPKEFSEASVPGAINIPILDDEERAVVGTIYKQVSKDEAISKGYEFFKPKTQAMIEQIKSFGKPVVVYCWRGGMRSKAVVSLFDSNVSQLQGGYKAYRKYVCSKLESFEMKFSFLVLCGMTGAGKTKMLHKFSNALDLEGLANHRGSLYGGVGLERRSQKMFESLLLAELERLNQFDVVIVEGESRKIGNLLIPLNVFKKMRKSKKVFLDVPINDRVKNIVSEYFDDVGALKEITLTMVKRLGKKNVQMLIDYLDNKEFDKFSQFLLENYYDVLYKHTMKDFSFDFKVKSYEELKSYVSV